MLGAGANADLKDTPRWAYANRLIVAASFFGAALTPSMMPREPIVQATLAAVAATFGYEVTLLARSVWRYLELPEPKGRLWTLWLLAACGISLAIMVYSLSKAANWQNATREAVGLPSLESAAPFFIVTVGVLIALCLWLVFRVAGALRRAVAVVLDKMLPRRVGVVLSIVLVGWFLWALVDGALVRNAFRMADTSFLAADLFLEPDIENLRIRKNRQYPVAGQMGGDGALGSSLCRDRSDCSRDFRILAG